LHPPADGGGSERRCGLARRLGNFPNGVAIDHDTATLR